MLIYLMMKTKKVTKGVDASAQCHVEGRKSLLRIPKKRVRLVASGMKEKK